MKKIILIINVFIVSCTSQHEQYFDMKKLLFTKDTIHGVFLHEIVVANNPVTRIFHTPYGLICCTNIENNVIQLLDISTGRQKATAGHIGRGPNEMLSTVGMGFDYGTNIFYCYDNIMKKIVKFEIGQDTICQKESISFEKAYTTLININDSVFVGLSFMPDQSFEILDHQALALFTIPYRIIDHQGLDYSSKYFNSGFSMSPSKRHIAVCDSHFPSIRLYTLNSKSLELNWGKMLFKPEYTIENQWIKFKDSHPMGFKNIVLTDYYMYILAHNIVAQEYRDRNRVRQKFTNLIVLNYKGDIVKSLVLDRNFFGFTVTPDDRVLYAFVDDPDTQIVRYQLPIL